MKKIILFLVILSAKGVCAQDLYKSDLSIRQIDSIAEINGRSGIAEGQINSEKQIFAGGKQKYIKGEGQSTVALYNYDTGKFTRLLKADYHRNIRYADKSSEEVFGRFYYTEKKLFFVKVTEIIKDGKQEKTIDHDIDVSKLDSLKNDGFLFTDNIRKWVVQVDNSIIALCKKKHK
jgi:hypothetical protein